MRSPEDFFPAAVPYSGPSQFRLSSITHCQDLSSAPPFSSVYATKEQKIRKFTMHPSVSVLPAAFASALPARLFTSWILTSMPAARPVSACNTPDLPLHLQAMCPYCAALPVEENQRQVDAFAALKEDDEDHGWARCVEELLDVVPDQAEFRDDGQESPD